AEADAAAAGGLGGIAAVGRERALRAEVARAAAEALLPGRTLRIGRAALEARAGGRADGAAAALGVRRAGAAGAGIAVRRGSVGAIRAGLADPGRERSAAAALAR